jgi:hypothetical protein
MYSRRSILSIVVFLVVAVATLAQAAEVVLITADQFVPFVEPNTRNFVRDVGHLALFGNGSAIDFVATVNLPVGKTITSLKYYHRGVAGQVSSSDCDLIRIRMGEYLNQMASASVEASTLGTVIVREDTTIQNPVVSQFYQYYIALRLDNEYSTFLGAKIYLQ